MQGSMDDAAQFSSVFDAPEAEPSELFINPFACNVSPLMWRELQVAHLFLLGNTPSSVPHLQAQLGSL